MDITPEEQQNELSQQKQSRGGFSNPLGKVGQRVVVQLALRGFAAFLAGPGLPIAIALGAVLLFTVIIVMGFGGGVPSSETVTPSPAP